MFAVKLRCPPVAQAHRLGFKDEDARPRKSVARMKLSTGMEEENREPEFTFGNFRLWTDGTFFREQTKIHLPPKELAALRFLLANANKMVTPAQLKQALWGDVHVTSDSVPRCLSSLRALLEPEQCIQTIYKRGYRLSGAVQHHVSQEHPVVRLAVMPFATGHHVAEHLGPAVAEEVTARLTEVGPSWISVVARDSVFTLARRGFTAAQVGESLRADFVLTGTLFAMPTLYRLRVEMIRVQDGTQIWIEDMLAAHGQLLSLETQIVQRLIFRLGGASDLGLNRPEHQPVQAEAYEMFLRGHHEWQSRERHRMEDGMQRLIQATELDPSLLAAHLDLANLCITQELDGFLSPDIAAKQIRHIAETVQDASGRLMALMPAVGWVRFHVDRDLAGALEMFSLSAQLPHGASTTCLRVMFALSRHRFDESLEWLLSALLIDPYAPCLHSMHAWTLHLAGQRSRSVEIIEKALELFPDEEEVRACAALIFSFNGRAEQGADLARELVHRTPYFDLASAIHAYALACIGRREEAHEILERLQWLSRERFVLRSFLPAAFAALGMLDEAIAELQAADVARCPWFFQMLADPRLAPLHGHPEFERMRGGLEKLEFSAEENFAFQG